MARTWGRKKERFSKTKDVQNNLFIEEEYIFKPYFSSLGVWRYLHIPFCVIDLLDCTTKWLTKTALDLTTPPSSSPDSPSSSSMAHSSPNWAVDNPQLPSSTMVLYQGYLNLLLWDLGSKEFPEVGTYIRTLPFCFVFDTFTKTLFWQLAFPCLTRLC